MRDRIPADPGRVKMTRSDGTFEYVTLERADNPTQEGTPLNKALLDYAVAACGVTAGTATALTLDDAFGGFTLVDGAKVNFRLHVTSGANPTLNVNGTGAKAITDPTGNALPPNTPEGAWLTATYNGIFDRYEVQGADNKVVVAHTRLAASASSIKVPIPDGCKLMHVILMIRSSEINRAISASISGASNGSGYSILKKYTKVPTSLGDATLQMRYSSTTGAKIIDSFEVNSHGYLDLYINISGTKAVSTSHFMSGTSTVTEGMSNVRSTISENERTLTISMASFGTDTSIYAEAIV